MKLARVQENRFHALEPLIGRPLDPPALARWKILVRNAGSRLQVSLGTSLPPLSLQEVDGVPSIRASGIAGTFRLGDVEWTVVPKFVQADAHGTWERSILALVRRADPKSFSVERRGNLGTTSLQLVDLFALTFAQALDDATRGDPVHVYRSEDVELPVVRGRLLVRAQLQHLLTRPQVFSCSVDRMNTDNPVNRLLAWAVNRFGDLSRSSAVRQTLRDSAARLPPIAGVPAVAPPLPVFLAPQYSGWREAVQLASLLALGQGRGASGKAEGYGFVLNMARTFERFVDAILRDGLARQADCKWERVAQASRVFAAPISPRTRAYWSRPDDVVYRDGKPAALVDAKYKLLADAEDGTPRRPSNGDVYQLACALVAHGLSHGLLVYPQVATEPGDESVAFGDNERKAWKVQLGDRALLIGAVALDLRNLLTAQAVVGVEDALLSHLRALLAEPIIA